MKLSFVKYLILVLLLTSCEEDKKTIKNYGYLKSEPQNLNVALKLSEFKNFGLFIDRISEITCNDSIPKVVIEDKNLIKNIYPVYDCNPAPFNPKSKHYVTFRNGNAHRFRSEKEINIDSLDYILKNDFAYYHTSNKSENPDVYYTIIESERSEKTNGIENLLFNITNEFDELNSKLNLNISFWNIPPLPPPPPPQEKSEQKIPQGIFIYELYFAEFSGRITNSECKVIIDENKITVEQTENTNLTGGKEIFKGLILMHKSGKWILADDENDVNADEIGGCTDIPIIEFDKKLIEWC
ncbi:hypothetical protein pgond44_14858 [Psychroflexus gondwanensis ACAM 44]|jgi:hypothetical protein|uniref:Lipoprotein n=1 Tax=Psychroflexus gondwanensis ACAM 44 TaxID=1189619 RepID=N1WHV0_9FLAO|nr:hypothetical protein [Psychroflexus gondwanensis]EMY79851.1 hypothetical protein pgond44_14858 [Psychroflexus gondwanensis ACAM 44]